ncbi:hypothetical protein GCM10009654_68530 [Streptomyces hebeiensis]|uniref:Uncharacterized protein n=1 Tax=Streptomyces hebeiensis TaxID=229486 RepID=A0ABN1VAY0_9ACTN
MVLASRAGLVLVASPAVATPPGLYGYALSGGERAWGLSYEGGDPSVPWTAGSSGNRTWISGGTTLLCLKQANV